MVASRCVPKEDVFIRFRHGYPDLTRETKSEEISWPPTTFACEVCPNLLRQAGNQVVMGSDPLMPQLRRIVQLTTRLQTFLEFITPLTDMIPALDMILP